MRNWLTLYVITAALAAVILLPTVAFATPIPTIFAPPQQLNVTAKVEAPSSTISLTSSANPQTNTILANGDEVTLTFTVKNIAAFTQPVTLTSNWYKALIKTNSGDVYIDGLIYIPNSTTGLGSATSIIDTTAKTVTWTIPSMPAGSTMTFSYKLRVDTPLAVGQTATVAINTLLQSTNNIFGNTSLQYTLNRPQSPTTNLFTSPIPTLNPVTTTVKEAKVDTQISSITTSEITANNATIGVISSNPTIVQINYGTTPNKLDTTIKGSSFTKINNIALPSLLPDTVYYFIVITKDSNGSSVKSDVYTFKTAQKTDKIILDNNTFTIAYKDILLNSETAKDIIVPPSKKTLVTLRLPARKLVSSITLTWQNAKVLGATSNLEKDETNYSSSLVEILPGIYSGHILTPPELGIYNLVAQVKDGGGNNYPVIAPFLTRVSRALTVVNAKGDGIERAEVVIDSKADVNGVFNNLKSGFDVSSFTGNNGELDIILPEGEYTVTAKAPRFITKTQDISVTSTNDNQKIILEADDSILALLAYYGYAMQLAWAVLTKNSTDFVQSKLIVNLLILGGFVGIAIVAALALVIRYQKLHHKKMHHTVAKRES
jgi:hypothetical protein